MAILSMLTIPTFGQYTERLGDYYGTGAEGTIGRGTDVLPWGPSDPRSQGQFFNFGTPGPYFTFGTPGPRPPVSTYDYASGYASAPLYSAAPVPSTPYLTTRFYEPGDGYRYPLYYNPSTRSYFYYPVKRPTPKAS